MKIQSFKERVLHHLEKIQDLINKMPQKGNTSSECQRVNLQILLNDFEAGVNGTEQKDLDGE